MSGEDYRGGDVFHVGQVHGGAVAFGAHSQAHHHTAPQSGAVPQEATGQLLEALRRLLDDLPAGTVDTPAGRELAALEGEITESGGATPDRLRRVRALVSSGAQGMGALASAAAVAESVSHLLG